MTIVKVAVLVFAVATCGSNPSNAETPDEWIALGARVHGAFGSFIPLGIKIGLDAVKRLNAKPRDLTVSYYDSDSSPCACFADGIAIATYASVGQRTLTISPEKAPAGDAAVVVIRGDRGAAGADRFIAIVNAANNDAATVHFDIAARLDGRINCRPTAQHIYRAVIGDDDPARE